ncbi:MAG: prepilin-type N-terminal cleavage/methylation domain-containing protein [Planctomycetaceae bacterium]|jgi:prepilin-type N-terminal cleavage/methylation domain-containing protein|nr:prepilin-type N-terminal cleavage/methylation domain-containing protein [Planctomycetaceae bacterium]
MFLNLKSQYGNRRTSGFTLLELLLVVGIMSVLAFSAISLTDTMDSRQDQYRYEASRNLARKIKDEALLQRVGEDQIRGFVADVGDLPRDMTELAFGVIDKGPQRDERIEARHPEPGLLTFANGVSYAVPIAGPTSNPLIPLTVNKGFIGSLVENEIVNDKQETHFYLGSYLTLKPGNNVYLGPKKPRFQDGWSTGQDGVFYSTILPPTSDAFGEEDKTHGWDWRFNADIDGDSVGDGQLQIKTLGRNGIEGGDDYDQDLIVASISPEDWSVDYSDIQIELLNDLFVVPRDCSDLICSLLVYNAKEEFWKTYYTSEFDTAVSSGAISSRRLFNGIDEAGQTPNPRIPAGTHILLLHNISPPSLVDNRTLSTPLYAVEEVQSGNATEPEVQRILIPQDSIDIPYRLSVVLPNPNDPIDGTPIQIANPDYLGTLTEKIDNLNIQFTEPTADDPYDSNPLEYDPANNSINIDIATAGQQIDGNVGIDDIVVIFQEPVTPETPGYSLTHRNIVRGKLVNILPGQTNIIRINLSTLAR